MPDAPVSINKAPEITIHINNTNEKLTGWTGFQVVRAIDACADAFAFSLPWDPTPENRKRFLPYSPGVIKIFGGSEQFLLGYIEVVSVSSASGQRVINLQGRSASGGLLDWSAGSIWDRSAQAFSSETVFELQGLTFNKIARKLAAAHVVKAVPDTAPINEVSIEPGQTLFDFLSKLAAANGYFGRALTTGGLEYRNDLGKTPPVCDLVEGESPVLSINTNHDVTKRFWKYKIVASSTGQPNVEAEAKDTKLSPAIRGIKIIQPSQQSVDYQKAANLARSRALIDSYSATVTVSGFTYKTHGSTGKFWQAGDVVRIYAPGAFILKFTKLIIKRVTFSLDENGGQISTLELGLPEAYSGGYPEEFPWED